MYPILYKYLMLHNQVCIPGIGRFYKSRRPSLLDFSNKTFRPPVYTISFSEEEVKADKKFYAFAKNEQGITEVDAIRHFHDFAFQMKQFLTDHNQLELPDIGHLKNGDGKISFISKGIVEPYFPQALAERITKKEYHIQVGDSQVTNRQMHEMLSSDVEKESAAKWWISAIILILLSIAAIIYYYVKNGNVRL